MTKVCTHINGQETKEKALAMLEQRCSSKKQYEYYRRWAYHDGRRPGALCA